MKKKVFALLHAVLLNAAPVSPLSRDSDPDSVPLKYRKSCVIAKQWCRHCSPMPARMASDQPSTRSYARDMALEATNSMTGALSARDLQWFAVFTGVLLERWRKWHHCPSWERAARKSLTHGHAQVHDPTRLYAAGLGRVVARRAVVAVRAVAYSKVTRPCTSKLTAQTWSTRQVVLVRSGCHKQAELPVVSVWQVSVVSRSWLTLRRTNTELSQTSAVGPV